MNLFSNQEIPKLHYYNYFRKLYIFFRNRKSEKFNQALGFDSAGIYRMDDTWIRQEDFVRYLDDMLDQKLLDHD